MNDEHRNWREFQERVAGLFRALPDCRVAIGEVVTGARIGAVEVDVVARFGSRREPFGPRGHHFTFTVLVECKFWNKRVPQEKLFALKAVVEDVGASAGILVSEIGVQRGAARYLGTPINVAALTFVELEGMASGMPVAECSVCGDQILVPFEPTPGRTVCRQCYGRRRRESPGSA